MHQFFTRTILLVVFAAHLPAIEHDLTISVYQGPCIDGDFNANLAATRQAVRDALARGSDFLVMPETFLSGADTREHMLEGARRVADPQVQAFIAESAAHNMVVLVGMARIVDEGLYNSILVIHKGKLLGTYSKMILTPMDASPLGFLPGKDMPVFTANGARFSVIICYDSSFPYPAMMAKLKGAEILFSPHYNPMKNSQTTDAHRKWVRNCHIGLACQLGMVVARSNIAGTRVGLGYGDSFIVSPRGDVIAEAELFKTEIITAKITPDFFKFPYVWGNPRDVPPEMKKMLADLLSK